MLQCDRNQILQNLITKSLPMMPIKKGDAHQHIPFPI